jgi:hypothetical protein
MMYSSALWPDSTGGVRGDLEVEGPAEVDLDTAQLNKLHYLLRKARVRPGDRVLEFGTGWGSMAIEVRDYRAFFLTRVNFLPRLRSKDALSTRLLSLSNKKNMRKQELRRPAFKIVSAFTCVTTVISLRISKRPSMLS